MNGPPEPPPEPIPYYDDGTVRILQGDSRELLGDLRADVIVTDPPYNLAFMGRAWDKLPAGFHEAWAGAALRALPPGGWLLAFGGTRTWHRLACGIEDAGFEIRDTLMWLQGQGFPKGKACLKPLWEPILLARKPGSSVLQIDASRVDSVVLESDRRSSPRPNGGYSGGWSSDLRTGERHNPSGRWPANVVLTHSETCQPVGVRKVRGSHDQGRPVPQPARQDSGHALGAGTGRNGLEGNGYADPDGTETVEAWECDPDSCPVFLLDQQSGDRPGFSTQRDLKASDTFGGTAYGTGKMLQPGVRVGHNDTGGASRFFATFPPEARFLYAAKAGRNERVTVDGKQHETVKPLALMRWLIRLVTPPGGIVLDPFCGSGSTLVAAVMEGFRAVGVEADERWCRGAAKRVMEIPPIQEALAL